VAVLFFLPILFLPGFVTMVMHVTVPAAAPQTPAPLPPVVQAGSQQPPGELIASPQRVPRKANSVDLEVSETDHDSNKSANGLSVLGDPERDANAEHLGSPLISGGTSDGNSTSGANAIRGTVAGAGFGNNAVSTPGDSKKPDQQLKTSVFGAATVGSELPNPKTNDIAAPLQPLVILDKPNPVYSEEARRLAIEGEVLIEVVFSASGQVRIVRLAKGLGHGLDEAATSAAQQIRFEPALQNGQPVDVPATVHILFQLAY
jgi:TonB family protein